MSRSKKGKKSCGQEYWTARPFNKCGAAPGPVSKKRTHRAERQQGKRQAQASEN